MPPTVTDSRYSESLIRSGSNLDEMTVSTNGTDMSEMSVDSTQSSDYLPPLDEKLRVRIDRPVYDHQTFDSTFEFIRRESDSFNVKCPKITCKKVGKFVKSLVPPLTWIPQYKKSWILRDIIVGMTVSVLSIPQAMAYATLANVPPVVGLYSSFFPTLLYAVFGTSKHIAYGMFAVPSLMVGSIVADLNPPLVNGTLYQEDWHRNEAITICACITLCLGIIFATMAVAQLHVLSAYLSDNLVAGFTTGAAFHVLFSQIPKLFAIKTRRRDGLFKLGFITYDVINDITATNIADLLISITSITVLMLGRYVINPKLVPKIKVPIPFELLLLLGSTLMSYFLHFEEKYNVMVVGTIPTGVPSPKLPDFARIPELLPKTFPIAVVIFGVTISVGKLFAKKHNYEYSPAQDLRAIGFIHLIVSFFCCHPGSGSLSRSTVCSQLGGKSQFASLTSATVVLVVVLWLAPYLYYLPISVLASIIFVALQGLFLQLTALPNLYKVSKIDFMIWLVAFLGTLLWDVSQGLLIAVGFALFTVILRTQMTNSVSLGRANGTELYRDLSKYRKTEMVPQILILRYDAPLLFVNASSFVSKTLRLIEEKDQKSSDSDCDISLEKRIYLIFDVSSISQVDQMGVEALKELNQKVEQTNHILLFATPKCEFFHPIEGFLQVVSAPVRDLFDACELFKVVPKTKWFPSVHDAVLYVQSIQLP